MESGVCVCEAFRLMCMCASWLPAVDASPQEEKKTFFPCQTKSLKGQTKASDSDLHWAPHK